MGEISQFIMYDIDKTKRIIILYISTLKNINLTREVTVYKL